MDAFVQLALIEKAKRVFAADPSIMLSFPLLSPLAFSEQELAALASPTSAADYAAAADFARSVNFVPLDMVASASDRMLWEIYRDVLARGEGATGSAASSRDVSGSSILHETDADGGRIDSEALILFRRYRDAWIVAQEDYAAHRLTGEMSEDPVARQQWAEVDERLMRAVVAGALHDWETLGRRAEIEAAVSADQAVTSSDPAARWTEWKEAFNPDLDMAGDAGGGSYAPTGFSPRNFAEQDGWLSFDLSAGEMAGLVKAAPEALKVVLDDDAGSRIARVTFEYRSVALVRPWFRPEVLTSRIWRSSDPDLTLSDGADPPDGVCPAYATACVFLRNLVVTEGDRSETAFTDLRFTIDPARLTRRVLKLDPRLISRAAGRSVPSAAPLRSGTGGAERMFRRIERGSFNRANLMRSDPIAARAAVFRPSLIATAGIRMPRETFGASPPIPSPTPNTPLERRELSILAFICKRLPKAPNPDPDLHWR